MTIDKYNSPVVYVDLLEKIMSSLHISKFFTVQEVAEFLQLNALTIYKYIKNGKLDAVEFGGHYRVSSQSLDMFIANHKVGGNK